MIANLVTTLFLALGVATGSYQSESSNAFNHVEKEHEKPQLRENESINYREEAYDITKGFQEVQNLTTYNPTKRSEKYIIDNNGNYNYWNDYLQIANTQYSFSTLTENYIDNYFIAIFRIQNLYDSSITLQFSVNTETTIQGVIEYTRIMATSTDETNNLLDLPLRETTETDLKTAYNNLSKTINYSESSQVTNYENTPITSTINTGQEIVAAKTIKTYIFIWGYTAYSNNIDNTKPSYFNMHGTAQVPVVNQEVIDIPNLMFTIITLPFAWYSTAFNLTIFPNTPYQVNFGNVILTIVGALILLYLIKKVLH